MSERLTDSQIDAIIALARSTGRERAGEQGDEFNEADYLAGVMTALYALGAEEHIPPYWFIGVMAGRPVLIDPAAHARITAARETRRTAAAQLADLRAARLLLETVVGLGTRCAHFLEMEE